MKINRSRLFIVSKITKLKVKCLNNEYATTFIEPVVSFTIFEQI